MTACVIHWPSILLAGTIAGVFAAALGLWLARRELRLIRLQRIVSSDGPLAAGDVRFMSRIVRPARTTS